MLVKSDQDLASNYRGSEAQLERKPLLLLDVRPSDR